MLPAMMSDEFTVKSCCPSASLEDNPKALLMVRNRVQEALRVSVLPRQSGTAPIFVYTRPDFVAQNRCFLSQGDQVGTIEESVGKGVPGAVLWGASANYDSLVTSHRRLLLDC
uniref:hyaluronidase PH-20-like n=1 Tax=Monopterus albus TaxID=43700 RepID=UPI0009B473D3|nr:hyaluronidase PH-20-like [Monopterus albus]